MGHDDAGLLISLLLGLGLGARHAFEPDHVAAIGALTAHAPGLRRGALIGMLWGVGHAFSLCGVGLGLAMLSTRMPTRLADTLELVVAGMLIGLGARGVARAVKRAPSLASGRHGGAGRAHADATHHVHLGPWVFSRPLLVGMIHGLAGSGALTAIAMAELPTIASRFAFITLFGIGSLLGMATVSGLWGWPLARLSRRPLAARYVAGATSVCSALLGLAWGAAAIQRMFA